MHTTHTRSLARLTWAVSWALLGSGVAAAHEGPPFPLVLDEPAGRHTVSIWADPDIGEARFFIILETSQAALPQETPQLSLWVEPVSGRLPRTSYPAQRQSLRNRVQFQATPLFDRRDMWRVGVQVANAGEPAEEIVVNVESTPPGFGAWDLAIYLFPFGLLGGLWAFAMIRRRRAAYRYTENGIPEHKELSRTA